MRLPAAAILRFFLLTAVCVPTLSAQPPRVQQFAYIDKYSEEAVHQMALYKIPASVILAQAIFESSSGQSELALRSNNHFGIKCHSQWEGDTVVKHDDTYNECFRKYNSVLESYTDHSIFIATRKWYKELFSLDITDYRGWCRGLKAAGYATFPRYAEELIRIIEHHRLYELDRPEKLVARMPEAEADIRISGRNPEQFSLREFSKSRLLFTDERDVYLRSLHMVVEDVVESDPVATGKRMR